MELRAWAEAEDVVEEAFVRLATTGRDLARVSAVTLRSCMRHVVADLARRAAVNRAAVNRAAVNRAAVNRPAVNRPAGGAGSGDDPRDYWRVEREMVERMRQAGSDHLDVVIARLLIRRLAQKEIATRLGLPHAMIRQRVHRIRGRFDLPR